MFDKKISEKKHIIWDWNGTIINDVDYVVSIMNCFLSENKLDLISRSQYRSLFRFPVKSFYEEIGLFFDDESFSQMCESFVAKYMSHVKTCDIFPQSLAKIKELSDMDCSQSVLSASDQESLEWQVDHFQLGGYFENVFGIDDKHAGSKLDRGRRLLDKINPDHSKDALLVGDTLHDKEVADALGIDYLLIGHGHQCVTRLKEKSSNVLELLN